MSENINEGTETTDIVDIELLVGALGRIVMKDSIAMQVSDVQRMKGPTARINGITRDPVTDKMTVTSKLVEAVSRKISTEFTQETLQDMKALYDEDFYEVLAYYLSDELAYLIDADFFELINSKATLKPGLTFDGATFDANIYDVVTQVFAKINKERVSLTSKAKRPLKNFAIVTSNIASLLMNNSILAQDVDKGESGVSLMGSFAGMDIYLDNTHVYQDLITSQAQQDTVTIGGTILQGETFTVTINGTDYTGIAPATPTNITTAAAVATALSGAPVSVLDNGDGTLTLTSTVSGTPYTIATSTNSVSGTISSVELTANITGQAEVVDYVTIGIKGNGYSKGSTIVAPYNKTFLTSTDESSGELRYHLLDRTAVLMNPSDTEGTNASKFLVKFEVDLNDLAIYQ